MVFRHQSKSGSYQQRKSSVLPAVNVDEFGGINVIYYDNRNISSDSMDVYLSMFPLTEATTGMITG
ncbi:MAG: hypothetical protein R2942_00120 [Ignavibacteria bacterium]